MLMLMLMKTRAKTTNMIRKHNQISNNNKTKHDKHCNKIKTTYANKDKGGSVFTARICVKPYLLCLQKEIRDLIPYSNPILIEKWKTDAHASYSIP